jgi:hypothetical protein
MLDWLFGAGIGTNLGASLIWAAVAGAGGWWLRGHVNRIHARIDALHASHRELHVKLDRLAARGGAASPRRPAR